MHSSKSRLLQPILAPVLQRVLGDPLSQGVGGYVFHNAEAAALVARFTTPPTNARKALIDTFVGSLKSAGVWSVLDLLYVPAAADSQSARLNWLSSSFTLTPVNGPTFTVDRGYAGDGASSYLTTGWNAAGNAVNFAQNSGAIGAYANAGTDTASNSPMLMGGANAGGTSGANIVPWVAANSVRGRLNSSGSQDFGSTIATRKGLSVLDRSAANLITGYRNGASAGTGSPASVALDSNNIAICAANFAGLTGFSDNRIAAAFVSASLGGTKQAALSTAITTYLTSLGAQ